MVNIRFSGFTKPIERDVCMIISVGIGRKFRRYYVTESLVTGLDFNAWVHGRIEHLGRHVIVKESSVQYQGAWEKPPSINSSQLVRL
jgi:hypothetical protein